ncbi:mediator of RNA polymerase II transcription subunit 13-like isoform X2 [Panonychus citri]|uniref:mediator of RNA polymerase II transcription subunit 13-like isoform X2 n=1 Tax=Panonychus citri TaxID=50023 RepID=UPI002307496E|nr:mediator of RNA polymerase II transcription subunit 13-like isoform X2 [Panonychus citri]
MVKVIPVIARPRNTAKEQLLAATEKDMTHPNITNGASLEDCYTNFFALADLCGIKWKRLTTPDTWLPSATGDPLDDPVLKAYSKCLAAELLCVWRRFTNNKCNSGPLGSADASIVGGGGNAKNNSGQGDGHPAYSKELWIFWYSEEPDAAKIPPNELIEAEQGSWENGLSYECRTLLFKAFHNLIERCLLSRGFARIGKWFLQPFEADIPPDKGSNASFNPDLGPVSSSASTSSSSSSSSSSSLPSPDKSSSSQLSFAFNFFVHGESTVCASVDVRVLPPVYRLTRRNLLAAQGTSCGLNVVLSPYGVAGVLTGQTFKDSDQTTQRLLQEWEKFYPLNLQSSKSGQSISGNASGSSSNGRPAAMNVTPPFYDCYDDVSIGVINEPISSSSSSFALPSVIEVSVAGIKMKYPSSYVYVVPENFTKKTDDNNLKTSKDTQPPQQKQPDQSQSQSQSQPQPQTQQVTQQKNQQQSSSHNPMVNLLTPPNTPPELHQSYLAINSNRVRTPILSPIQLQIPSSTCRIRNNAFQEMNISHQSSKSIEQNSTSSSSSTTNAASLSPTTTITTTTTTSPSSLSTTTVTSTITTSTTTSSPSISTSSNLGMTGVSGTSTPTPTPNSLTVPSTTPSSSATNTSNGISGTTSSVVSGKATPTTSSSTLPTSALSTASSVTALGDDLIAALAKWDFCDPSAKVSCSCHRCKTKKSNNQSSVNSKSSNTSSFSGTSGTNKKFDKTDKDRLNQKASKNVNPFHHRPMFFEELDVSTVQDNFTNNNSNNNSNNNNDNSNNNVNSSSTGAQSSTSSSANNAITQPPSVQQPKTPNYLYKSPGMSGLPSIQSNATTPGGTAIDSPRSCAPFSDGPASGGPALDASLSSISPHPVRDDNNIYSQEPPSNDPSKGINKNLDGMSPHPGSVKGSGTIDSPAVACVNPWTPSSGGVGGGSGGGGQQQGRLNENDTNQQPNNSQNVLDKTDVATNGSNSLKRPMLPVDSNENDLSCSKKLLYDFTCIDHVTNVWDIPMPKNRRVIKGLNRAEIMRDTSDHMLDINCYKSRRDPYEFNDEEFLDFMKCEKMAEDETNKPSDSTLPSSGVNDTIRSNEAVVPISSVPVSCASQDDQTVPKEGPKSAAAGMDNASIASPKTLKVFTREEDLRVSDADLNNIFESDSDEESSSEFSTPNAPKSNKSPGLSQMNGNTGLLAGLEDFSKGNSRNNASTLAELTMIFPTPPSMEHNTAPSPCNTLGGTDMTLIDDNAREKLDGYPNSPTSLENAKDWSYVYKPPIQCKFLTSSKYAPLTDVASLTQYKPRPDCVYKQQEPSLPFQTVKSQTKTHPHQPQHPPHQIQQNQQPPHSHHPHHQQNHLYSDKHSPHPSQPNSAISHLGPSTGLIPPSSQPNQTNRSSSGYFHQFGNSQQQNSMVHHHHGHPGMMPPHQMNSHFHPSQQQQSPHHHLNHHPHHHPGQNQNMAMSRLNSGQFSPSPQIHQSPPIMGSGMRIMRPGHPLRVNYPPNPQVSPFMQGHQQTPNMYMNPQFSNSYGPGDRMMSANHPHFSPLMDNNGPQPPFANHPPYHHQMPGNNSPLPGHHPSPAMGNINGPLGSLPYDVHSHQNSLMPGRTPLPATSPALPTIPDAHCILINLVLSDSMLNLFKDHNFESCTLCACNGNIKGSDVGIYLPESLVPSESDEPQYKCTCGFSAVSNRHRSYFAGLFYEDEFEITGVAYDPLERLEKKPVIKSEISIKQEQNVDGKEMVNTSTNLYENDQLDASLVDLLRSQCSTLFPSSSLLAKAAIFETLRNRDDADMVNMDSSLSIPVLLNSMKVVTKKAFLLRSNALQRSDGCEIAYIALIAPKQVMNGILPKMAIQQLNTPERLNRKASCLHEWSFNNGYVASNNIDVVRLLRNLTPLLQKSVQKKPQAMWEVTYTVSGPLTWRQFHRLAGRGTEDQCEPQPIPSLLVGHDNDWVALSPFALKYWEKLMLEPYSVTRDVAYLVLAPDDSYILSHVKTYFKELSTTYEMLRLGRHCPIAKVMRDGIMRVGKTVVKNIANEPIDDWFNQIGDGSVASKIKLYARACRYYVAPYLSSQNLDKSLFDNSIPKPEFTPGIANANRPPTASPHHPPDSMNTNDSKVNDDLNEGIGQGSSYTASHLQDSSELDDDPNKQPVIVIYIVEPFTFANMDEEVYRLSCLGLLRCYAQMLNFLPEHLHNSINLQLVSLDSILGVGADFHGSRRQDQMKALAFSVFNQCRKVLVQHSVSKSLTGFGPAASLDMFLKSKDPTLSITRVYTPPYILAPLKDKQTELGEMFGDGREKSQILYCAYCLTEDQKWLVVTCSNDKGDLLESTLINIEIPNRTKRKKASAKKFGLYKILEFIFSVMTETIQPWRLVIGRVGRVGHGELREWNALLSKKSLLRYSRLLRDKCRQCSMMTPYEIPSILSACLVSLEADTALRVFPDHFTPDDRYTSSSSNCHLSTPEEASCTHILVFPTSAASSSSQAGFGIGDGGIGGINEDDLLQALGADGGTEDLPVDDDLDLFQWPESPNDPSRDPVLNHPDSPRQSGFDMNMKSSFGGDLGDDPTNLLQQPLALGYYVSTAQTGPLPKWFWSSCPHLAQVNPAFLKSALLIHTPSVQQNTDDFSMNNRNCHPLDSNLTTDVLRYVLEGYNSLSWVSLDPATHDRLSCLPTHIQILMQLYHTVQALV